MKIHKNSKQRILITLGVAIILITVFYFITSAISQFTGYVVIDDSGDDFKDCLKENKIILFINSKDILNSLNNIQVEEYLDSVKIKNCNTDNSECLDNGVINFPFWIINKNKIHNDITVRELSEYTGCKLND
ncbi:hypothetical protein GOV12_01915 [Candidatus Pacearchaeota archaeon]|nr:hypothetical protein [Candidatus Pacearchaeota archaeon]